MAAGADAAGRKTVEQKKEPFAAGAASPQSMTASRFLRTSGLARERGPNIVALSISSRHRLAALFLYIGPSLNDRLSTTQPCRRHRALSKRAAGGGRQDMQTNPERRTAQFRRQIPARNDRAEFSQFRRRRAVPDAGRACRP